MKVGIAGCGQLSRMLALAGWPMGMQFSFLADPNEPVRCVEGLGEIVRQDGTMTARDIYGALGNPDVITIERESVCVPLLIQLKSFCQVYPDPDIVWTIQNRHREKTLVSSLGIPLSPWAVFREQESVNKAIASIGGLPVVIKSTEDGYDGHNQWVIDSDEQLQAFEKERDAQLADATYKGIHEWIVEKKIAFEREISVIGARSPDGNIVIYTPGQNTHSNGILIHSVIPAPGLPDSLHAKARDYVSRLLQDTEYVGVLAVECFVTGDELLVNELAPRVHNSGHWTMDGAATSQFENHMRAIAGLPLGDSAHCGDVMGMYNLLGQKQSDDSQAPDHLMTQRTFLHWYNKTSRPGRKLGHLNILAEREEELLGAFAQIKRQFG
ncbi:5-(carboxyamino)imidazole ribonucleotide synthase [Endozoicomonas montiporae]|uniref:N5-carboxyaminoimidazole ribonucleotide synthase n=1 Tax=Endozoicomonas montiporae CL-33 TaxID=570277 RepID=A0A142B714_9GAMM|nr:5-(carboxyamino)imidazole ribonucleotide synthase [Endozoicomonas montiporae]AMO54540.1 phosphoribosylaminoimidazole carboxylase [Endozoicomonas montiporae CL-33]